MAKLLSPFQRWLLMFFSFIACVLAARIVYTGHVQYIFLVWNLFLAFLPYAGSFLLKESCRLKPRQRVTVFAGWFLFFPNALYIITDIIHLGETSGVPLWYDAILLFSVSFAGLAMAFASLVNVEQFLRTFFSAKRLNFFICLILFVASFGVYLGRFERWNSWDIIRSPFSLFLHISADILLPLAHYRAWSVTLLLTALYYIFWKLVKAIGTVS